VNHESTLGNGRRLLKMKGKNKHYNTRNNIEKINDELFAFEKYKIYKQAFEFLKKIYNVLDDFPHSERHVITSQLKRSALSIVLNLAEGSGNYYQKEKIRYLRIARGSIFECIPSLRISLERKYINYSQFKELYHDCYELSKQTSGLIRYFNSNSTKK
jgi:four helix bundle protein